MMRISYKLTKRTTKTKKIKKHLKISIISFKTIHLELTALVEIAYSILLNKVLRPVSNLQLSATGKNCKFKNLSEKSIENFKK